MTHCYTKRWRPPFLLPWLPLLLFPACSWSDLGTSPPTRSETYSMNGIKLIAAGIERGDDPSTFQQGRFELAADRRLLMRFEDLSSHVDKVRVDSGNKVEAQLTLEPGQSAADAQAHLKICPIIRNWMMLATWQAAHPFSDEGHWAQPGADYDPEDCASSPERVQDATLTYDVTNWFVNYVRGRNENYGLVVVTDAPIAIYGDSSGSFSPRLSWTE